MAQSKAVLVASLLQAADAWGHGHSSSHSSSHSYESHPAVRRSRSPVYGYSGSSGDSGGASDIVNVLTFLRTMVLYLVLVAVISAAVIGLILLFCSIFIEWELIKMKVKSTLFVAFGCCKPAGKHDAYFVVSPCCGAQRLFLPTTSVAEGDEVALLCHGGGLGFYQLATLEEITVVEDGRRWSWTCIFSVDDSDFEIQLPDLSLSNRICRLALCDYEGCCPATLDELLADERSFPKE